jgi:hypothetical protein
VKVGIKIQQTEYQIKEEIIINEKMLKNQGCKLVPFLTNLRNRQQRPTENVNCQQTCNKLVNTS